MGKNNLMAIIGSFLSRLYNQTMCRVYCFVIFNAPIRHLLFMKMMNKERERRSRQPELNSKQLLKLNINSAIIIIFHVEDASFGKLAYPREENIERAVIVYTEYLLRYNE